jgi:hypothetical protein
MVAAQENGALAKHLFAEAIARYICRWQRESVVF